MSGGCQGCAASAATLRQGVERMVKEEVPEIREIVDITDHTAGSNPYY
jgi:Fe/S biogenesis protein NfuA